MANSNIKIGGELSFQDIIGQADQTFRQSMTALTQVADQVRDTLETKPGVFLAGLAMAGFLTGSFIRGKKVEKKRDSAEFAKDATVLFIAGSIAGIVAAPFFKDEIDFKAFSLKSANPLHRH